MAAGGNPRSDGPGGDASGPVSMGDAAIRLDKWLFHARFAKSRGVAARLVSDTGVRINGARAAKSAQSVRPGDVLTFALGPHVRVVRILAPGTRRGPAPVRAGPGATELGPARGDVGGQLSGPLQRWDHPQGGQHQPQIRRHRLPQRQHERRRGGGRAGEAGEAGATRRGVLGQRGVAGLHRAQGEVGQLLRLAAETQGQRDDAGKILVEGRHGVAPPGRGSGGGVG